MSIHFNSPHSADDKAALQHAFNDLLTDLMTPKDRSSALHNIENLVFQGGGVKGVAYIGVLEELQKQKPDFLPNIKRIAGTSAGSMLALYLGLNMELKEIKKLICDGDFFDFLDDDVKLKVYLNPQNKNNLSPHDFSMKDIVFDAITELKKVIKMSLSKDKDEAEAGDDQLTALLDNVMNYYSAYTGFTYNVLKSLIADLIGKKIFKILLRFLLPKSSDAKVVKSTKEKKSPNVLNRQVTTKLEKIPEQAQNKHKDMKTSTINVHKIQPVLQHRNSQTGQFYAQNRTTHTPNANTNQQEGSPPSGLRRSGTKKKIPASLKGLEIRPTPVSNVSGLPSSSRIATNPESRTKRFSNPSYLLGYYTSRPAMSTQEIEHHEPSQAQNTKPDIRMKSPLRLASPRNRPSCPPKRGNSDIYGDLSNISISHGTHMELLQPNQGQSSSPLLPSHQSENLGLSTSSARPTTTNSQTFSSTDLPIVYDEENLIDRITNRFKKILESQKERKNDENELNPDHREEELRSHQEESKQDAGNRPKLEGQVLHYAIAELIYDLFFREQSELCGKETEKQFGLFTGSKIKKRLIEDPIRKRFKDFGLDLPKDHHPTFRELAVCTSKKTGKPCFRNFYVTAFNTRTLRTEVFSVDHTPDAVVADVIRASMSIPFFFKAVPIKEGECLKRVDYDNGKPTQTISYMDGGIFDNFPMWIFDDLKYCLPKNLSKKIKQRINITNPRTLGFKLMESKRKQLYLEPYKDEKLTKQRSLVEKPYTGQLFDILELLLKAEIGEHEESKYINQGNWTRTAYVEDCDVSTFAFKMELGDKDQLMEAGRRGVQEYLHRANKNFAKEGVKEAKLLN